MASQKGEESELQLIKARFSKVAKIVETLETPEATEETQEFAEAWETSIFGFLEEWIRWIINDPSCPEPDPAEPFWEVVTNWGEFMACLAEVKKAGNEGRGTDAKNWAFIGASIIGRAAQIATGASADSAVRKVQSRGGRSTSQLKKTRKLFAELGAFMAALDLKKKNPRMTPRAIAKKLDGKVAMAFNPLYRFLLTVPILRRRPGES